MTEIKPGGTFDVMPPLNFAPLEAPDLFRICVEILVVTLLLLVCLDANPHTYEIP